jgi:uncharacterized protein YneF (UPF0154 family)
MQQLLAGIVIGIWIDTKYDCKQYVDTIKKYLKDNIPKSK